MDLRLEGRVVLVTGSSRGIGGAVARQFGREQARVAVTYRTHRAKAEAVCDSIRDTGGVALAIPFDLGSDEAIGRAVSTILETWGRVDVLINNAVVWGSSSPTQAPLFEEISADHWRPLLRANLEGVFRTTQAVVPSMRKRKWGRIVNISSGIAADGLPGSSWYGSVKAALHGLTRTLAKELGPDGILTNVVVMPGFTLTERNAEWASPEFIDEMAQSSPIRRVLPSEEVAPIIVFLGSAANTAVNGEILRASGGAVT